MTRDGRRDPGGGAVKMRHDDVDELMARLATETDQGARSDIVDALATAQSGAGLHDAAIATLERAVAEGYREMPDVRVRIAEEHLLAGREERWHELLAEVRRDTPGDVWLYNNAGLALRDRGRHVEALAWFSDGLEIALDGDDREQLVAQLADLRRDCLERLGEAPGELDRRADAYVRRPVGAAAREGAAAMPAVLAWFPVCDYERAIGLWPTLAPDWADVPHREYSHRFEGELKRLAAAGVGVVGVAPVRIDPYLAWAAERGIDAEEPATRAEYAAVVHRASGSIPWPPGRNEQCWCGSGAKYKRCCGPVDAVPAHPVDS